MTMALQEIWLIRFSRTFDGTQIPALRAGSFSPWSPRREGVLRTPLAPANSTLGYAGGYQAANSPSTAILAVLL